MKGKLIVIDGADGSGKATQSALLVKRLEKEGFRARTIDFPRYGQNLFGSLIGECLAGKHGDFVGLDPRIASVLYAADRFESKETIRRWLAAGYVVVADRYVSANQIHQGGKIGDRRKQREFLSWLERMEFGIFGLPKPDLVVYLDVPRDLSEKLLAGQRGDRKKSYLDGRTDQHEDDPDYLDTIRMNTLRQLKEVNRWKRVSCARSGAMLAKEAIADRIWQKVRNELK